MQSPRWFLLALLTTLAIGAASARTVAQATTQDDLQAVLDSIGDASRGEQLFKVCAECHGRQYAAGLPNGWVPEIAGQHPRVLEKQLVDYRHGRRWDDRMEWIAGKHLLKGVQDIADVATYVGGLAPPRTAAVGSGDWVDRGQVLYVKRCTSCHGNRGEGSDARFVPRLAGQRYEYLLRQMHDIVEGRRPNMAHTHVHMLENLGMEDLAGLADYLSRLSAPSGAELERRTGSS